MIDVDKQSEWEDPDTGVIFVNKELKNALKQNNEEKQNESLS
ncbi:hypothetical protein [Phocoenobacter skyensis]|uniref:Uncharacterized protein n=1 Tax=Phocoenobacter skyensis TaxID=97481 RepID=A0A1H7XL37_9PAST|nr:hypothetical protein [Pasteurella skyensis]MDP8184369.1 hypothetical protein [Pasteurella skyensis]SEM34471.1 hypothetical protein SAMN05444853_11324 [Pasteurella skyensis]